MQEIYFLPQELTQEINLVYKILPYQHWLTLSLNRRTRRFKEMFRKKGT